MNKLTKEQLAYIAGFVDADGCIAVSKQISYSERFPYNYSLRLIVVNSDTEVIKWFKEILGVGCIYVLRSVGHKPNWKAVHRYTAVSNDAREIIKQIIPYLRVKKERAIKALKLPVSDRGHYRTDKEYSEQEKVFEELKRLNTRGIQITI